MTDTEYNHLVGLRNECYRDRIDRESEITYFTGFNDGYEKGKESLAKENAELEQQIEKMKADVKQEQSYWNSGEMQYCLLQRLLDKWEIKE